MLGCPMEVRTTRVSGKDAVAAVLVAAVVVP
jgi:hypothetical protein